MTRKTLYLSALALVGVLLLSGFSAAERDGGAGEKPAVGPTPGEYSADAGVKEKITQNITRVTSIRNQDLKEALSVLKRTMNRLKTPACTNTTASAILGRIFSSNFSMPSTTNLPDGARYIDRDNDTNPEVLYLKVERRRIVDTNNNSVPEGGMVLRYSLLLVDRDDNGIPEKVVLQLFERTWRDPEEDGISNSVKMTYFKGIFYDRNQDHVPDYAWINLFFGMKVDNNSDGNPERIWVKVCRWIWMDRNYDRNPERIYWRHTEAKVGDPNSDGVFDRKVTEVKGASLTDRNSDGNPEVVSSYFGNSLMQKLNGTRVIKWEGKDGRYLFLDRNSDGRWDQIRVNKRAYKRVLAGRSLRMAQQNSLQYSFTRLRGGDVLYQRSFRAWEFKDRNGDRRPEKIRSRSSVITMRFNRTSLKFIRVSAHSFMRVDRNSDGNPEMMKKTTFAFTYTDRNGDRNPELVSVLRKAYVSIDNNSDGKMDKRILWVCGLLYIDRNSDGNPEVVKSWCNRTVVYGGGSSGGGRPGTRPGGGNHRHRPGGGGGGGKPGHGTGGGHPGGRPGGSSEGGR